MIDAGVTSDFIETFIDKFVKGDNENEVELESKVQK